MARWKIKNVGMKGVAMAVPKNVVKTSDFDFFSFLKKRQRCLIMQSA